MIIFQHQNFILSKNTKAFLLESNDYYKNVYENFLKTDIQLKLKIGIGIAICGDKDMYSRKVGRTLAASRIQQELTDIVSVEISTEFVTFYLYSKTHDFSFKLRFLKNFLGTPRILFI